MSISALVTGGGGFLGGRIAEMLHARGDIVTVLGRGLYPQYDGTGIATIRADIRDAAAIVQACDGKEVVFHVAALAGIWGRRRTFREINVDGTRNVIGACRARTVPKLVYTSTPSVVFGDEPLCGVDESQPYPSRHLAAYPETKAAAERMVLAANSPFLATVALRPHLIWGPGDPHLIPRVIARARAGSLRCVGDGRNLVDITYIANAAEAHLLAADVLRPGSACAGRPYFISQGEPVELWSWLDGVLEAVGAPRVSRGVSFGAARRAGFALELVYGLVGARSEPRMTRFLAAQLGLSHYFDISAARRDLGYTPRVSAADGLALLVDWLRGSSETPGSL